jgi:hypothetical protein
VSAVADPKRGCDNSLDLGDPYWNVLVQALVIGMKVNHEDWRRLADDANLVP